MPTIARETVAAVVEEVDNRKVVPRQQKDCKSDSASNQAGVDDVPSSSVATSPTWQGHSPMFALDLTTCDEEERPWDLAFLLHLSQALKRHHEEQPWVVIATPLCTNVPTSPEHLSKRSDRKLWNSFARPSPMKDVHI